MRADESRPTGDQDPHVGLDQAANWHRQSGSGARPRGHAARGDPGDGIALRSHLEELGEAER
jgi:hypothetical protein